MSAIKKRKGVPLLFLVVVAITLTLPGCNFGSSDPAGKINSLESDINSLKNDISFLKSHISDLESKNNTLESKLKSVENDVSTLGYKVR